MGNVVVNRYFQIMQAEKNLRSPSLINDRNITADKLKSTDAIQIYVKDSAAIEYPDIMDSPFLLVSDQFKKAVQMYNKDYDCRPIVLTEKAKKVQNIYWHIDLPNVDYFLDEDKPTGGNMMSRKSAEFYKVDSAKVKGLSFFMFQWKPTTKPTFIIRLDLAESLLRRDIAGFDLKGLEHI